MTAAIPPIVDSEILPFGLPLHGALMSLGVGLAGFLVTDALSGRAGVADLRRRSMRWRVPVRWYLTRKRSYIFFIGGLFGRYGSSDLVVMLAPLRLFETVVEVLPPGSARLAVIERAAVEALADAERSIPRPPSLQRIRAAVKSLRSKINARSELKPIPLLDGG